MRTLLAYIENGQSVLRIVALLLFMACVEIVFYHLDNHLKQVYFVNFETKLKENVNENIFHAARNAGYEVFCDPKFLNQYRQVLDNTAAKMAGIVQASGAALRPLFCIRSCACVSCEGGSGSNSVLPVFTRLFVPGGKHRREDKIHFQSCDDNGSASLQMRLGDLSDEIEVFQQNGLLLTFSAV